MYFLVPAKERISKAISGSTILDGVRYSNAVSQAWSYARKELVVLHRGPGTRLKKRLIEERNIFKEELRYMRVHIVDVAALDSKCEFL